MLDHRFTDASTILSRTSGFIAQAGFTHSLTPARNCTLGCSYCYVPTMRIQGGLRPEDWQRWGKFTTFKQNAAALLINELREGVRGTIVFELGHLRNGRRETEQVIRRTANKRQPISARRKRKSLRFQLGEEELIDRTLDQLLVANDRDGLLFDRLKRPMLRGLSFGL